MGTRTHTRARSAGRQQKLFSSFRQPLEVLFHFTFVLRRGPLLETLHHLFPEELGRFVDVFRGRFKLLTVETGPALLSRPFHLRLGERWHGNPRAVVPTRPRVIAPGVPPPVCAHHHRHLLGHLLSHLLHGLLGSAQSPDRLLLRRDRTRRVFSPEPSRSLPHGPSRLLEVVQDLGVQSREELGQHLQFFCQGLCPFLQLLLSRGETGKPLSRVRWHHLL